MIHKRAKDSFNLLKASGAYVIHMRLVGEISPNPLASDFQSDW